MGAGPSRSPLVSVIIPAYQASRHINATLDSARRQTLEDIEIIVVDDGSTDDTPEIVSRVGSIDKRVRLVTQANRGVAAARNRGIEAARAQYVAPLDADDLWRPDKLELQVAAIEQGVAGYVLAYCWYVAIDTDGRMVGRFDFRPAAAGDAFAEFVMQNLVGASGPLLKRSVVETVGGYDPTLRMRGGQGSEDWKLFAQMAATGPVTVVPRFLMGYRRVPGSMSRDHRAGLGSHLTAVADIQAAHPEVHPDVFLWSELIHATFMARTYWRERACVLSARMLAWAAWRGVKRDILLPFRPAFRSYLALRMARRRDAPLLSFAAEERLPFLEAGLSAVEATALPRLEAARTQFQAAVLKTPIRSRE